MKALAVSFIMAVSLLGTSSFVHACELKNLKKTQRRGADGTAFIPHVTNKKSAVAAVVSEANNKVFIGN